MDQLRFLIDAQLPNRLALKLSSLGFDTHHTNDLPRANNTHDDEILAIAQQEDRIVVTKDSDFLRSHILDGVPSKLLLVSTGNISNTELIALFSANIAVMIDAFQTAGLVELRRDRLLVHK